MSQHLKYLILPSAGSAGLPWTATAQLLDANVIPLPEYSSVEEIASALVVSVGQDSPPVLVGSSLGAMVALHLASRMPVKGLVLVSAGWGIDVDERVLAWVASNPPGLLSKVARAGASQGASPDVLDLRTRDLESRGAAVLLQHLTALAAYRPHAPRHSVPSLVIHGEFDRSVPETAHVLLARKLGCPMMSLAEVGHSSFAEDPGIVASTIRLIERLL